MLTYKQLARKPRAFTSMTGLTIDEFQDLLTEVQPRFVAAEQQRFARPDRQRAPGGGLKPRFDVTTRLLMTLIWLRLYLTCDAVGVLFDVDKSTVSRCMAPILRILRDLGTETLGWPEEAQALMHMLDAENWDPPDEPPTAAPAGELPMNNEQAVPVRADQGSPDQLAIVDATEQRVRRPRDHTRQREHYSGKKKVHTRKTQLIVNERGRIRHISASRPGAEHDVSVLRQSKAVAHIPAGLTIMADSADLGLQDDVPERSVALPYRANRWHPLTPDQKLHNQELASHRIIIEHTIGALKRFRILADVFRHTLERYDTIMLAVTGLVNRRFDRHVAHPVA